jgi:hypothetical protein
MGMKTRGVSEDDLMMAVVVGCRDVVTLSGTKLESKRCYTTASKAIWPRQRLQVTPISASAHQKERNGTEELSWTGLDPGGEVGRASASPLNAQCVLRHSVPHRRRLTCLQLPAPGPKVVPFISSTST